MVGGGEGGAGGTTVPAQNRKPSGPPIISHCGFLSHYGKLRKRNGPMPPDLRAFLTLHATVGARDEEATRQVLRDVALNLPQRTAHKVVSMLERSIGVGARVWLKRLA